MAILCLCVGAASLPFVIRPRKAGSTAVTIGTPLLARQPGREAEAEAAYRAAAAAGITSAHYNLGVLLAEQLVPSLLPPRNAPSTYERARRTGADVPRML